MASNKKKPEASNARFYVYELADPRDGVVFYVGKGTGSRASMHERDVRKGIIQNVKKFELIADIVRAGLHVAVRVVRSGMTESQALALEATMISDGGQALTNIAPHGTPSNKEVRELARARDLLSRMRPQEEARDKELWLFIRDGLRRVIAYCEAHV